jgi:hypothetical protein
MNNNLYYFRYPQYLWANEIMAMIKRTGVSENTAIVDAPCGDGIISYWLQKEFGNKRLELYDLSPASVEAARKHIPGVRIECKNIFELGSHNHPDALWLFINSLYCLPDADKLVESLKPSMQYIIGVFPDINHQNYKYFCKDNPQFINPSAMDKPQTMDFFKKHGYNPVESKEVTFISNHHYRFKGKEKLFNLLDLFFRWKNTGAYWISLFKRS